MLDLDVLHLGGKSEQCRALVSAMNRRLAARHLAYRQVHLYKGPMTLTPSILSSAVTAAWALGAQKYTTDKMEREGIVPIGVARMIRNPGKRTQAQKELGIARINNMLKQRKARAGGNKPTILTASSLGLTFQNVFGPVGSITRTFGHYTAGPRARSKDELIQIAKGVHAQHRNQGWGGCSYGPMFADDGTILLINPISRKAAGVAGHNTGSVHLNVPGTTGDTATDKCEASIKWYMTHAHTTDIPRAYRSPVDLRKVSGYVHKDVNATSCPGDFTPMYRRVL